jgi:hypothetical protein
MCQTAVQIAAAPVGLTVKTAESRDTAVQKKGPGTMYNTGY